MGRAEFPGRPRASPREEPGLQAVLAGGADGHVSGFQNSLLHKKCIVLARRCLEKNCERPVRFSHDRGVAAVGIPKALSVVLLRPS